MVLGLGFAFLIFTSALDQNSLALDEGWSLWAVHPASPLDSLRRVSSDVHPPLYFLLLDGWTALAGESVYAARLLSTYFALFGLAATYALAHRLFDNWTGLIAVVWLGSTGFVVYYAREVRAYTLLMALSALSTLAYVRWRGAPRRDTLALYAGLLVALLYTHYVGVWIIVVHGLH
ncbi:MAG: glycosyltransferase family 39 protein, partial [Candidatus Methanoperedens sp.]|nr:glycosyltransferase family 39 protein [Candidatus Methanoperedens sp.]